MRLLPFRLYAPYKRSRLTFYETGLCLPMSLNASPSAATAAPPRRRDALLPAVARNAGRATSANRCATLISRVICRADSVALFVLFTGFDRL